MFTGVFIYLPLLFFKNISVATAIGVGMHWCQYIAIIWSTYLRKWKANNKDLIYGEPRILKFIFPKLSFIFIYAFLMTSFAFFGMRDLDPSEPKYSILFLIPLIFQLYHFYIDGFIWKFSDKHIKKTIKPYIYSRKV